jgi:hypothetical protein
VALEACAKVAQVSDEGHLAYEEAALEARSDVVKEEQEEAHAVACQQVYAVDRVQTCGVS